jgi:mannose-1-phosphate guanylyltransferase
MLHFVIMAGGAGTRFWPESRAARPKQFLPLAGERTMLQMTLDRLGPLANEQNVWVLTAAPLVDAVAKQLPQVPRERILGEPCKRDTAPCIGLAALMISRHDPDATMVVLAADHVIRPAEKFQEAVSLAASLVQERPRRIVTFGIKPTYPATIFGYIERGEPLEKAEERQKAEGRRQKGGQESGVGSQELKSPAHPFTRSPAHLLTCSPAHPPTYHVAQFREKPPADIAEEYVASGRFYWNSGMFVWKAATILSALEERQPETISRLKTIVAAAGRPDFSEVFNREFAAIKGISIDYAVMEHAQEVAMVEAAFDWDDLGTWQAVARQSPADADGNTIAGRHVGMSTANSIIRTDEQHLIATVGVNDLIVVHTPDATLVANRHDEESVRRIVKLLEERGWMEYL